MEWLNDIKVNQLQSILGGVGPTYSFVKLFQGTYEMIRNDVERELLFTVVSFRNKTKEGKGEFSPYLIIIQKYVGVQVYTHFDSSMKGVKPG